MYMAVASSWSANRITYIRIHTCVGGEREWAEEWRRIIFIKEYAFWKDGRTEGRKEGLGFALGGRSACGTYSILTRPFGISLLVL